MIRKSMLIAAASLGLAFASPLVASQASDFVSEMAEAMQFMVGPQEDSDMTVVSIKAEGEVLVLRVDGPKGWRKEMTADQLSDRFMGGFCQDGANILDQGVKIRIETTEASGENLLIGPNESECPA